MNLKEVNEALNLYVKPQTLPIAIRMCESADEIPEGAKRPKKDFGVTVAACEGTSMARRYGWTVAIGREDQNCPYGEFILGFVSGKGYLDGSIPESLGMGSREVSAKTAQATSRLEPGKYNYMLAAPLETATFDPHLIMVVGTPSQVSRLVRAAIAAKGGFLTSTSRAGLICSIFLGRTMVTDECQFVLPGGGFSAMALTQDHEMVFAMPVSKMETVIQGLERDHKSGRHVWPSPLYSRCELQFPETYSKFLDLLRKE